MTTTLVFGDVADGYLHSADPAYATARNGPADGVNTGTTGYYGQNNNGGTYTALQTFIRFAYPAVAAGELVTSAAIRLTQAAQLSTGVVRDMELRGAPWGTSLSTADWRTPAQLSSAGLFGVVRGIQASTGKNTYAGSEALRSGVQAFAFQELVVISSRQRAGNVPTTDEGSAVYTGEASGTGQAPLLVFTTTPRHALVPVMGGEAQLSDGSWVFLTAPGAGLVELWRGEAAGVVTFLGSLPLGTGATDWADVPAAQGVTLAVDAQDNIYVVGRAGDAPNSIRHRAYVKAAGSWAWAAGTVRTLPLPAHDAPINNVTAAWHSTAGGTLVVFAAHQAGEGQSGSLANDLAWVLIGTQYLLTGAGTHLRASGSAVTAGLVPSTASSGDFNGYTNEVGTGLDVVADRFQADWGYLVSYQRGQRGGENDLIPVGRYILASTGAGFSHASYEDGWAWAKKEAASKARILSVGAGQMVAVTADSDPTYGLSVHAFQASGTSPGFVALGSASLAGEGIPSMPNGAVTAATPAWDAIYSPSENAVWVYYVDAANPARVMRTAVDLDTYRATRQESPVYTAAGNVTALRAPRNAWPGGKTNLTVATAAGSVRVVDTLNLPPTAPTLTPRGNYDATTAAAFTWAFNDPNAGDAQSAYSFQVERVDTGELAYPPALVKWPSSSTTDTVPAGTLANGQEYRWRVMTWDAADLASPWSDWGTFSTSAGTTATITAPATDNPPGVITDDYWVSWSVTGTAQAKFRIWVTRNDTGATIHESFITTGTQTSWRITDMVTDVEHTIHLITWDAANVSTGEATRKITPSYSIPEVPVVTLEPVPEGGYVLVAVDNPLPQGDRPDVARNRIFRRPAGTTGPWDVLGECEPDGSFRDYTAPGQVPVEYMVRGETS